MAGNLRVTQVKSTISHIGRNRATVRALGLHRIGDTVVVPDNDATRGMVRQVRFLVNVEELPAPEPARRSAKATSGTDRAVQNGASTNTDTPDAAATETAAAEETT
jgi:large subunit ribosomal protein L30